MSDAVKRMAEEAAMWALIQARYDEGMELALSIIDGTTDQTPQARLVAGLACAASAANEIGQFLGLPMMAVFDRAINDMGFLASEEQKREGAEP